MDSLETLRRKIGGVTDLKSVVRTMKVMAASNIGQYEMAVASLKEYYHTVALGIAAYFHYQRIRSATEREEPQKKTEKIIGAIVFGSDLGLVGQFNASITDFVTQTLNEIPGKKEVWAVGERVHSLLSETEFATTKLYAVPRSVTSITALVGEILLDSEESYEKGNIAEFYVFHHQPNPGGGYLPVSQRLLPLDEKWRQQFEDLPWPTNKLPQVAGDINATLAALIHEYLFVSLFRACAESLYSENASRLAAMQRAEKNIDEMMDDLNHRFHFVRQNSIDEELFDIVSGFEAMKAHTKKTLNK
jgi:F-type H+-transporting ATPase subunit gamma